MTLLVKEGTHKALFGAEKKPSKMKDDKWMDLDVRVKVMVIPCLLDEVLYNVINEKITVGLWCKLESLYITHIQKLKAQLKEEVDMKDLGEAKKILRIEIS